MNQIIAANKGIKTKEIKQVAKEENIGTEELIESIKSGQLVILKNKTHELSKICAVGDKVTTKVDANYGTGWGQKKYFEELEKMKTAINFGADTIMDLSLGGDIDSLRIKGIKKSGIAFGTVPVYQAAITAIKEGKNVSNMHPEIILETIKKQAKQGVDFMTIHAGVDLKTVKKMNYYKRTTRICSRGGSLLAEYMLLNNLENPMFTHFEEILKIAKKYDITLSLGSGLRSGSIHDSTDIPQVSETLITADLHKQALEYGVQSMIEGPGHMVMSDIVSNVKLIKKLSNGAPIYLLGPIVLDIATGYDNIVAAIGGAIAAEAGANLLCYVTPVEHIRVPNKEEVRVGVISSKIAAHAADLSNGNKKFHEINQKMSKARFACDWDLQKKVTIDKQKFEDEFSKMPVKKGEGCTLCGKFCAYRSIKK